MANALAWYYQEQDKPFIFRCCNRLDRDTSGLTVVAKHLVSAGILSSMTGRREVHREYLAIASGHVTPERWHHLCPTPAENPAPSSSVWWTGITVKPLSPIIML